MKKSKIITLISIVSILALALVGCTGGGSGSKGEIVFSDAGWDSNKLHNAIAGTIAEEVWGYSWSEVPGATPVVYEGLLNNEIDVSMEIWSDNIATYDRDLEADKFKELSINFDDNSQGIYVPRYVIEGDSERGIEALAPDLKTIEDLKKYPEVFPDEENPDMGRMYGSIPGWEIDEILYKKFQLLNLDENFIYFRPGSDAALATAISSAYEKGEPIAAYYWEPTWLIGLYDMVLLEDEEGVEEYTDEKYQEGKTSFLPIEVTVGASNNFYEDEANEEIIDFLSRYETSSELTSEGLAHIQESGDDYKATAQWFLKEHPELLDQWLNEEDAAKMKDALDI